MSITAADYAALTASFPAKGTDGKINASKYPNAPRAGQRGFLPASFDVEEHLANTGHADDQQCPEHQLRWFDVTNLRVRRHEIIAITVHDIICVKPA